MCERLCEELLFKVLELYTLSLQVAPLYRAGSVCAPAVRDIASLCTDSLLPVPVHSPPNLEIKGVKYVVMR
jgi:hypothetical protein